MHNTEYTYIKVFPKDDNGNINYGYPISLRITMNMASKIKDLIKKCKEEKNG